MQCLTEPELFQFLALLPWTEIIAVAQQKITFTLTTGDTFEWVYIDPMRAWCFNGGVGT